MSRLVGGILGACCVLGGGARAQAQAQPAGAAVQAAGTREAQARAHFERGLAFVQQARWADAAQELEAARALQPVPAVLFNLGVAHRALGHNLRAIEAFRAYLAGVTPGGVASREAEVRTYVNDLTATLGRVALELDPADAVVTLDGEGLPPGAREREVDPGEHVLTFSSPRHRSRQRTVRVAPGARVAVRERLDRAEVVVRGPSPGPFVLLGLGAAGVVTGAVLGALSRGAFARYEQRHCDVPATTTPPRCEPMSVPPDPDYAQGATLTIGADIAFGVGGAVLVGGGAWLLAHLVGSRAEAPRPVSAFLAPGPRGGLSLGVGGSF